MRGMGCVRGRQQGYQTQVYDVILLSLLLPLSAFCDYINIYIYIYNIYIYIHRYIYIYNVQ